MQLNSGDVRTHVSQFYSTKVKLSTTFGTVGHLRQLYKMYSVYILHTSCILYFRLPSSIQHVIVKI